MADIPKTEQHIPIMDDTHIVSSGHPHLALQNFHKTYPNIAIHILILQFSMVNL